MSENVLVIAAHPDDEILGSGGTIKKLINHGYKVITVIVLRDVRKRSIGFSH